MKESDIQKQVVKHCRNYHKNDFFLVSVPNEAIFKVIISETMRRKVYSVLLSMGFRPGFPDLLFFKKGKVLAIEMKSEKGSLNDNQKKLFPFLEKFVGEIPTARSLQEVLSILEERKFM